ncbi:uncharacterized protein LOC127286627 [Leptopilina boulardi]|uniref:uncharacterized protein LOC127286627 n=1 Tax=Leptopilina boulardi TaxID=63433 RepID=UPI0021F593A9|nr:uncharacterized protein LOC127286627 [Leptopilina boulardi]
MVKNVSSAKCIVKNCRNSQENSNKQCKKRKLTMHRFPKDPSIRKEWIKILQLNGMATFTDRHRVCSEHFLKQDIDRSSSFRIRLRKNAIPVASSIYPCEIKKEINNDSEFSEWEEEKFSPEKLNNFESFITPIKCERRSKTSPTVNCDTSYTNLLKISVMRQEEKVESEKDLKSEKLIDRRKSVSPKKKINISFGNGNREFICNDDNWEIKNNDERIVIKYLNEKLRLSRVNIVSMENDITNLKEQIKKLQDSVTDYTMTVKIY